MNSSWLEEVQKDLRKVSNKQIEITDRIANLEKQVTQFTERMTKLEELILRLEQNPQGKRPYGS